MFHWKRQGEGKTVMKEDFLALSLPETVVVCGVEIKKMPLGAYISAIHLLKDAPFEILEACFPGESIDDVLIQLKDMEISTIRKAAQGIFVTVPEYFVKLAAKLTGIDEKRLLEDENIGLWGMAEIVEAFIQVNRLGKFAELKGKLCTKPMTIPGGSKK